MKKRKTLKLLYFLIIIFACITLYFLIMAIFGKTPAQEEGTGDENPVQEDDFEFDDLIQGKGTLRTERVDIDGVKTIIYFLDEKERKPLVIIQHGLGSKKEEMKDLAVNLAYMGYIVVTPDAAGHGEAIDASTLSLMEMVVETADHFEVVIEYFADSMYVDVEKIGLLGISLGGMASFYYTANGSYTPQVVASMCSTPDFNNLLDVDTAYEAYKKGKLVTVTDSAERKKIEEEIKARSPYEQLLENRDTDFMLFCGKDDRVVPCEGATRLYEDMKSDSPSMELIVKEGQGHEVYEEDCVLVLDYILNHLK